MQLRGYQIQTNRTMKMPFFIVERVNYDALLDTLTFPVIWAYDSMLEAWIPAETDQMFCNWLVTMPYSFDENSLPKGRLEQLYRHNLLEPVGRKTLDQLKVEFQTQGCVKIPQMLNAEYCKRFLTDYYFRNEHEHQRWADMEGIKRTSANNMPIMRLLHQATERFVNKLLTVVGEQVKTSYSFASAYEAGTNLPAHTDRPQCVWNISFMLGSNPTDAELGRWPLYVQHDGFTHTMAMNHGDAVLYSGVRDLHWRDTIPTNVTMAFGVFFHYVPVDFTGSLD